MIEQAKHKISSSNLLSRVEKCAQITVRRQRRFEKVIDFLKTEYEYDVMGAKPEGFERALSSLWLAGFYLLTLRSFEQRNRAFRLALVSEGEQAAFSQSLEAIEPTSITDDVFYPAVHGLCDGVRSSVLPRIQDIDDIPVDRVCNAVEFGHLGALGAAYPALEGRFHVLPCVVIGIGPFEEQLQDKVGNSQITRIVCLECGGYLDCFPAIEVGMPGHDQLGYLRQLLGILGFSLFGYALSDVVNSFGDQLGYVELVGIDVGVGKAFPRELDVRAVEVARYGLHLVELAFGEGVEPGAHDSAAVAFEHVCQSGFLRIVYAGRHMGSVLLDGDLFREHAGLVYAQVMGQAVLADVHAILHLGHDALGRTALVLYLRGTLPLLEALFHVGGAGDGQVRGYAAEQGLRLVEDPVAPLAPQPAPVQMDEAG